MIQKAIMLTNNNIAEIAEKLSDYTIEDLKTEIQSLPTKDSVPVLVIDVHDDETVTFSHLVTLSMFFSNATANLNAYYFQPVTQL